MSLAPGSHLGPYEILGLVGAGGMGEVYRAHDSRLGRDVAVKVLPEEITDPNRLRRFETEARATGGLNHPNILTIYDVGEHAGRPFLVAELLEGETLNARLADGKLPFEVALRYAREIAAGLAAAHERGIVHRDIKPGNLFITRADTIKILDFGLAKLMQPEDPLDSIAETRTAMMPTQPGLVLGTVGYMSPEQARGVAADERADLFSFGAVLYEMLTGERPFSGETPADLISAILTTEPAAVSSFGLEVPAPVENLIASCLAKDPTARPASARDIVEALAGPAPGAEAASQRGSSRKFRALLGAALATVILGVILVMTLGRSTAPSPDASTRAGPAIGSIAVLPLDDFSGDSSQEYFTAGMTEALIANLSRIGGFKVISRTSVMQYRSTTKTVPQIAAELGVEALVEGSVLRSGNRVRITAQLIEAATDHHLWAESFEREIEDVLSLQSEVAQVIAREIGHSLGVERGGAAEHRKVVPEAYDAFLKAKQLAYEYSAEPDRVIAAFEEAIDLDPSFAPPYALLSELFGYYALIGSISTGDGYLQSRQLARRALELDPDLPQARLALARVHFQYEWDWAAAETEFQRALDLDPENADTLTLYGDYRVLVHRDCDGGLSLVEAASDRDPMNPGIHFDLGVYSFHCRRWDQSIAAMTRVLELTPQFFRPRMALAWNDSMKGEHEKAARQCKDLVREVGDRFDPMLLSSCAWVYKRGGPTYDAARQELLSRFDDASRAGDVDPIYISFTALAADDDDRALTELEEALRKRSSNLIFLQTAPIFDPLRDHPRFKAIVEEMDFPE